MTSNKLLFAQRSVQATLIILPMLSKTINLDLKFSVLWLTISCNWQNSSLIGLVSHGFSAQSGHKAQESMYLLQFLKNFWLNSFILATILRLYSIFGLENIFYSTFINMRMFAVCLFVMWWAGNCFITAYLPEHYPASKTIAATGQKIKQTR